MYKNVSTSSDPKEIGVNNGIYQVELLEKKSFVSNDEKKYYKEYFNGNVKNFLLENFENIKKDKVSLLTYFPLKKAKETDFISFSPDEMGLNFIVSQRIVDIFESFDVFEFVKIPTKIEGFKDDYYTVGFPMIEIQKIDFKKSIFIDWKNKGNILVHSYEEFMYQKFETRALRTQKLFLTEKLKSEILYIQTEGLFFSDKLIAKLEDENVTGFQVRNTELE
ncbi:hypothetical protein [Flavobacterium sp. T12S277]|uniref:hypothetical protein n=1 Tax=Flavobacterium sp. T12S277 TaxID=3402752 RepID=UPI003AEE1DF9